LTAGAGTAVAGPDSQCDIYQRQIVRVALSLATGGTAIDEAAIKRAAERQWASEGLDIEWIDERVAASDLRLDAWVVVERSHSEWTVPPRADGLVRRIARVSLDNVAAKLEQKLSIEMQLSREAARHLMFGSSHLIEQSLGRTIAHQLGHSVMGLRHGNAGLMSARYDAGEHSITQLDEDSRRRLQQRFAIGCASAR
jgi:hypothetical protein